eukprot:8295045-Prorocentrum_lima.AAC.1
MDVESRGLGDVYKRQSAESSCLPLRLALYSDLTRLLDLSEKELALISSCLLYTSDAADDM